MPRILTIVTDKKADQVVSIDIRPNRSALFDYIIIATALSGRQLVAISESLREEIKKFGIVVKTEGGNQSDWILVDCGPILVHLFKPESRKFYHIEDIWAPRPPHVEAIDTPSHE